MGSESGAVLTVIATQQCGPGSNPGVHAVCGLSLLLVLSLALRGFSPGTPVLPSPQNPKHLNSNSIWNARTRLSKFLRAPKCFVGKWIIIYNFNGTIQLLGTILYPETRFSRVPEIFRARRRVLNRNLEHCSVGPITIPSYYVFLTKWLLFCLRYDPLIVFRRQNHITFIFIKIMSHDLLVQMAYCLDSRKTFQQVCRWHDKTISLTKQTGLVCWLVPALLFFRFWFEYLFLGSKSYRNYPETDRICRRAPQNPEWSQTFYKEVKQWTLT